LLCPLLLSLWGRARAERDKGKVLINLVLFIINIKRANKTNLNSNILPPLPPPLKFNLNEKYSKFEDINFKINIKM